MKRALVGGAGGWLVPHWRVGDKAAHSSWTSTLRLRGGGGAAQDDEGSPPSSAPGPEPGAPHRASLLPGSVALAAAGCCGLALRFGLGHALAAGLGGVLRGVGAGPGAAAGAANPGQPQAVPAAPVLAALGLGAAAAATPAGFAAAQFAPFDWSRLERRWRGRSWGWFPGERRATDVLIALNVAVYGLQKAYPGLVFKLARINHLVSRGELWRLLTPSLVHASLLHLGVNMLSLHLLGPTVESCLGRPRFLAVYAGSAITGNALAWWVGASGYGMAVGASSSISGLFGAYAMFRWLNRHRYGLSGGDLGWLAQVVGINVLIQLGSHSVDGWSHLGGALGGAAVAALLGPRAGKW